MATRTVVIVLVALGTAQLFGFPAFDWIHNTTELLLPIINGLFSAFWQLLQPGADVSEQHMTELHQAVLNVTRDVSRVADLLEVFMEHYSDDPDLREKFISYMAVQATTSYSVVDKKLSWVLWLYSLIWMPLLLVMCLARTAGCISKYSRADAASAACPTAARANVQAEPRGYLHPCWEAMSEAANVHDPCLLGRNSFSKTSTSSKPFEEPESQLKLIDCVAPGDVARSVRSMRQLSSTVTSKPPHHATDISCRLRSAGSCGGDKQLGNNLQPRHPQAAAKLSTVAAHKQCDSRRSGHRLSRTSTSGSQTTELSPAVQEGIDIWARLADQLQPRGSKAISAIGSDRSHSQRAAKV